MPAAPKVALTAAAIADLDRLDLFLRRVNPAAAERLQDRVAGMMVALAAEPRLGRRWARAASRDEIRERVLRFGRSGYVVRYSIEPEVITILRIHHGRERR